MFLLTFFCHFPLLRYIFTTPSKNLRKKLDNRIILDSIVIDSHLGRNLSMMASDFSISSSTPTTAKWRSTLEMASLRKKR